MLVLSGEVTVACEVVHVGEVAWEVLSASVELTSQDPLNVGLGLARTGRPRALVV